MYASRKPPYKIHEDLQWGGWSVQENFQYISVLYDIFMYGGYGVLKSFWINPRKLFST